MSARASNLLTAAAAIAVATAIPACGSNSPGSSRAAGPGGRPARTQQDAVNFARCLRSHGFPSFPDPTRSGELTHEMLANSGINLHQPAVRQAADACVGVTHGVVTRAVVARFIAGE